MYKYMSEQEAKQNQLQDDRISALEKGQERILELLEPMADNYLAALKLGKWIMGGLLFTSAILGVLFGVKNLLK